MNKQFNKLLPNKVLLFFKAIIIHTNKTMVIISNHTNKEIKKNLIKNQKLIKKNVTKKNGRKKNNNTKTIRNMLKKNNFNYKLIIFIFIFLNFL